MTLREWSKSEFDYGRKLVFSGIEGARSGSEIFLDGKSLDPFLSTSCQHAWLPAGIGACVGMLAGDSFSSRKSGVRVVACGLLGAAIGFTAGIAWESRSLLRSVASGVLSKVEKVRDEHWLEKHPIDYA